MLKSESREARRNIIHYFLKRGLNDKFSSEVRIALVGVFYGTDELRDEAREVILHNPYPEFAPTFRRLLTEGTPFEQQRCLECLDVWLNAGTVNVAEMKTFTVRCSASANPWIRFLACVQLSRHLELEGGTPAWKETASAIAAADHDEWWRSIRPQAEEYLSATEIVKVNSELDKIHSNKLSYQLSSL